MGVFNRLKDKYKNRIQNTRSYQIRADLVEEHDDDIAATRDDDLDNVEKLPYDSSSSDESSEDSAAENDGNTPKKTISLLAGAKTDSATSFLQTPTLSNSLSLSSIPGGLLGVDPLQSVTLGSQLNDGTQIPRHDSTRDKKTLHENKELIETLSIDFIGKNLKRMIVEKLINPSSRNQSQGLNGTQNSSSSARNPMRSTIAIMRYLRKYEKLVKNKPFQRFLQSDMLLLLVNAILIEIQTECVKKVEAAKKADKSKKFGLHTGIRLEMTGEREECGVDIEKEKKEKNKKDDDEISQCTDAPEYERKPLSIHSLQEFKSVFLILSVDRDVLELAFSKKDGERHVSKRLGDDISEQSVRDAKIPWPDSIFAMCRSSSLLKILGLDPANRKNFEVLAEKLEGCTSLKTGSLTRATTSVSSSGDNSIKSFQASVQKSKERGADGLLKKEENDFGRNTYPEVAWLKGIMGDKVVTDTVQKTC